jgi:hypothetical protein
MPRGRARSWRAIERRRLRERRKRSTGRARGEIPPDLYHAGAFVILNSYRGAGSGSQGRSPHACTKWRVRVISE